MEKFLNTISNGRTPIFVDLNNILYRMYYVFSPDKFKSSQGLPNGHLFGLCQTLRTMDKLGYEIFLCEDSKCEWRRELNEDYKSNRQPSEGGTEFWKDYPKIRDLISNMPHVHSLASSGFEADDIMYSAAKICSRNNIKCKVFTMDKDLLQALDENIDIVHKVTLKENEEIKYDSPEYWEKFPVKPELLPYFRAFKGDSSDNLIAPVKRFPKDLAIELSQYLKDNGSLKDYNITKKSHEKWIKQLADNWSDYCKNYRVMKLNDIEFTMLEKSKLNSYQQVCKDYDLFQFYSYIKENYDK